MFWLSDLLLFQTCLHNPFLVIFVWQVVAAMLEVRATTALAISVVVGLETVEMEA